MADTPPPRPSRPLPYLPTARQARAPERHMGTPVIEYTYYKSGDWKATCLTCGAEELFDSLKGAFEAGRKHDRAHA